MAIVALHPEGVSGVAVPDGGRLPLGSVLVAQMATWDTSAHLTQLAAIHGESPWVPLAVVGAGGALGAVFSLIRGPLKPVEVPPEGDGLAEQIWGAVTRRPAPGTEEIAWYCGLRMGPAMAELVEHAMTGVNYRSLRRRLQVSGSATPGAWRRRLTVIGALSHGWGRGWTEASAALEVGRSVETLSRSCRRCFGLTWPQLVRIRTWEGVLEQALRWDVAAAGRVEQLDRSGRKVAKGIK